MKKFCVLLCLLLLFGGHARAANNEQSEEKYDPQFTVQALNYALLSIHHIEREPTKLAAIQEFENIINLLDITQIRGDKELRDLYEKMGEFFREIELEDTDRDIIKRAYEAKAREAYLKIPSKTELRCGAVAGAGRSVAQGQDSGTEASLLVRLLGGVFEGVANWWGAGKKHERLKDQARGEEERYMQERSAKEWQLEKARITKLKALKSNLRHQTEWVLANKYKIKNKKALLTDKSAEKLYTKLINVTNARQALKNAGALKQEYATQPQFWFFYGKAALACNEFSLARDCFTKFEELNRPILLEDAVAASAAAAKIQTLKSNEIDEARRLLDIIVDNAPNNGAMRLFAGLQYFAIGDMENAQKQFTYNINILEDNIALNQELLRQIESGTINFDAVQGVVIREFREPSELERLAETENPEAQYKLGEMLFRKGKNNEALRWLKKATKQKHALAEIRRFHIKECKNPDITIGRKHVATLEGMLSNGNPDVANLLGDFYQEGCGVNKDYAKAIKYFKKAAATGDSYAQLSIGVCYIEGGYGITQDHRQAANWFRKAAEQEEANAQNFLGLCYEEGWGVDKAPIEAVVWYSKAADQGHAPAQYNLAVYYLSGERTEKDMKQAAFWLRKAAAQEFAEAQNLLGWCYDEGLGVNKAPQEAVVWYRKAAEQGNAQAQHNLGMCYKVGDGVAEDWGEAIKWFEKAAQQGNENAKRQLDILKTNSASASGGQTTSHASSSLPLGDKEKQLLREAERGDSLAQNKLGHFYYRMGPQHYVTAAEWFRKAAISDDDAGQYNLGLCYENGIGVDKDRSAALFWYNKAAAQGNGLAKQAIDRLK